MAEWYLATYQNSVFSNDLGIIESSGDYVYKLKNSIDSGESPKKEDWLRITITDNTLKEWVTDETTNNSSWTAAGEDATGLVSNSTYWVYGFIVKYIILTNSQTYYLDTLETLDTIGKTNITNITITNSVTEIGQDSFSGINDVIFIIPESVLTKLNEADTSLGLTYGIGKSFFFGASTATLVKDYPYYTFITNDPDQIHYLPSFIRDNNTITGRTLDNTAVTIDTTTITSIIIGNSVTVIGYKAFYGCENLTSVTIGEKVEIIGYEAFEGCENLASLTIGDSVTTIGDYAFNQCSSLVSTVDNPLIIPNSVETIGVQAFYGCTNLASVTIGDSVTSIGVQAFYGCSSLVSLTIPDSVETIGDNAFRDCSSLTSLTMGDSVETIGNGAFYLCSSLASLNIPNSVTEIGFDAFDSNTNITLKSGIKLTSFPNISSLSSLDTNDFTTTDNLIINTHTKALLRVTSSNSVSITIPDNVTSIGKFAFYNNQLASVTIPDSVTSIGGHAFYQCSSLASVTIPDSVTSIGDRAFSGINSNNDDEAIITISQNTVRSLMDDNTLPYTYTSGNKYTGETFFSDPTNVTLNVI